jgi:hypothetical protein
VTETERIIGDALQRVVLPLNPEAAYEKAGAALGLLPASPETDVTVAGVAYRAQVYRHSEQRDMQRVVYAPVGQWDALAWFERPNTPLPEPEPVAGYYIDSARGDDSRDGRAPATAWRSLGKLPTLRPGDIVNLACGSFWDTGLIIAQSGTEAGPIVVRPYGSGPAPAIANVRHEGTGSDRPVYVTGSWIVLEGLCLRDSKRTGISLARGAGHCIVRGCEAYNVSSGVTMDGQNNLVTDNHFHNLTLEYDTGTEAYGAVGVSVFGANNEVCYNRLVDCQAASATYGVDGGAVELYGQCDGNHVHHNTAIRCRGFAEFGGGSVQHCRFHDNLIIDCGRLLGFHTSGQYAATVGDFHFYHNTVVDTDATRTGDLCYFYDTAPAADALTFRDNIISVAGFNRMWNRDTLIHHHNLYHLGRASVGYTLGEGETRADPLFVDAANGDYRLRPGSPAIGTASDGGNMGAL